MDTQEIFKSLRRQFAQTHVFTEEDFAKVISFFSLHTLKKKDFFNRQDYYCRHLGYVYSGSLRALYTNNKGDEYTMYFAFADAWVGDKTSFYSGRPSMFSIQALEDSILLCADKPNWEKSIDTIPVFEKWYRSKARKTYEDAQRKLIEWQTETAEEKYVKLLNEAPAIVQRIPQHYIASYFGIKPQSLSRIRKNMLVANPDIS